MNILIINQPQYNRGDESAHKGLVRSLITKCPNAKIRVMFHGWAENSMLQFAVHHPNVEYIKAPYSGSFCYDDLIRKHLRIDKWGLLTKVPMFKLFAPIYKWADLVVCAPGGICMGGFQDWDHLIYLVMTKFYHKPLAYYGRSFGPFPTETKLNREFKKKSLEMLKYFCFLSIRDHKTELLAQQLKVPYISTVDSAFLDDTTIPIPDDIVKVIGNNYMVFVPNYLIWHYAYKGKITKETVINFYCQVIELIKEHNPELKIVMLPQLFGLRFYELNDYSFFLDIKKKSGNQNLIVLSDTNGSDIQQAIIKKATYLIGARYHSIVFAVNQGTPFISLSYEHKMCGLLETLSKSEWGIDFTSSLLSEQSKNECLSKINELIPKLDRDNLLRQKAKQIANNCMDKFIDQCIYE